MRPVSFAMRFLPRVLYRKRAILLAAPCAVLLYLYLADSALIDLWFFTGTITVAFTDPPGTWLNHPVELLHERARADFETRLKRQSRTADEAEREYKRRYGKDPPPGFRRWADYALAKGTPVIDDYDDLSQSVHGFHNLHAAVIRQRFALATAIAPDGSYNNRIGQCDFQRGKFSKGCGNFAEPLTALLGDAKHIAPEVSFLINFLDEPSVLSGKSGETDERQILWKNGQYEPIGPQIREACSLGPRSVVEARLETPIDTHGLPFVQDVGDSKDLCRHPEYESLHGFVMNPTSFMQMQTPIPLLSQAAPRPFLDILYPSTHYGLGSSLYNSLEDRSWKNKENTLYWTGSTTGGWWKQETWPHGHRQRLAELFLDKAYRNHTYLQASGDHRSSMTKYQSDIIDHSVFDVAITRVVPNCVNMDVCIEEAIHFGVSGRSDPEWRPFRSRFVLDIDGNSYSGRFYRFLASHSAPLKVSIFREWHDERLVPWLHYIPVSQSFEELPELMRFLSRTREGQAVGRRVAEAGRDWYFKALAPVHQGVYLYRLLLELAWLQNDTRHAS